MRELCAGLRGLAGASLLAWPLTLDSVPTPPGLCVFVGSGALERMAPKASPSPDTAPQGCSLTSGILPGGLASGDSLAPLPQRQQGGLQAPSPLAQSLQWWGQQHLGAASSVGKEPRWTVPRGVLWAEGGYQGPPKVTVCPLALGRPASTPDKDDLKGS